MNQRALEKGTEFIDKHENFAVFAVHFFKPIIDVFLASGEKLRFAWCSISRASNFLRSFQIKLFKIIVMAAYAIFVFDYLF